MYTNWSYSQIARGWHKTTIAGVNRRAACGEQIITTKTDKRKSRKVQHQLFSISSACYTTESAL